MGCGVSTVPRVVVPFGPHHCIIGGADSGYLQWSDAEEKPPPGWTLEFDLDINGNVKGGTGTGVMAREYTGTITRTGVVVVQSHFLYDGHVSEFQGQIHDHCFRGTVRRIRGEGTNKLRGKVWGPVKFTPLGATSPKVVGSPSSTFKPWGEPLSPEKSKAPSTESTPKKIPFQGKNPITPDPRQPYLATIPSLNPSAMRSPGPPPMKNPALPPDGPRPPQGSTVDGSQSAYTDRSLADSGVSYTDRSNTDRSVTVGSAPPLRRPMPYSTPQQPPRAPLKLSETVRPGFNAFDGVNEDIIKKISTEDCKNFALGAIKEAFPEGLQVDDLAPRARGLPP